MQDFKQSQDKLRSTRARREQIRLALFRKRERLARIKAEQDKLVRSLNAEDAQRHSSNEQLARLHSQLNNLQRGYRRAHDQEKQAFLDFAALTDPRKGFGSFRDDIPWLLLPIRIETRFKTIRSESVPQPQHELWVRIYPDEAAIDTFEPFLSESELKSSQLFWIQWWQAGGVEAQRRAAWRGLVASHGSGRAAWLEQNYRPRNRSQEPRKARETDIILVIPTDAPPTDEAERAVIDNFWQAMWRADHDPNREKTARAALEEKLGKNRTESVLEYYQPANFLEQPRPPLAKTGVGLAVAWVVCPRADKSDTKRRSWSQAPRTFVLPDRFLLIGYVNGQKVLEELGNPIPSPLIVGPDPSAPPETQIKPQDGELMIPEEMRWMVDFERAVEIGMGFRIKLDTGTANGFDRLLVLGLRLSSDENEGQALLETLIQHHRDGHSDFSIVPQGTPTNNTEGSGSGFSWADDADLSFDDHFGRGALFEETSDWRLKRDGQWLGECLGIDPEILKKVRHSNGTDQAEARAMNVALWPATVGYFMETMMQPVFSDEVIEKTRRFFNQFVSGRGPIPAIRIGNQPYGILPATAFSRLEWVHPKKLTPVAELEGSKDPQHFLSGLYHLLRTADGDWAEFAKKVSHLGQVGDAHQLLLDIVGLHSGSVEFYQRYAQSVEDLYNRYNLGGQGQGFIGSLRAADYVSSGQDLLKKLGYTSLEGQPALPDILNKFFLSAQQQLDGPLIDDRPLSEMEGIRSYTDDGRNYIQWLLDAARNSLETVRLQSGFKDNQPPTALLYLFLRHALLLGYWETGLRLYRVAGLMPSEALRANLREPAFIHVREQAKASESRWGLLYKEAKEITHSDSRLVAEHISLVIGQEPAAHDLGEQIAALDHLKSLPTARLERIFAEHVDCCTYRLDAWQQGLVWYQLTAMRGLDKKEDKKIARGIYLGAYGWLEEVRPENKKLSAVPLEGELKKVFNTDTKTPLMRDRSNGGYIHAPSLNHAVTAAILRNGYLSNATSQNPRTLAVNLSSERVRLALSVLEGIRNGQSLGALLGYQLERGLHDRYGLAEVDQFIFKLRKAFPLVADRMESTKSPTTESIESIEARNVVDGLELVTYVRKAKKKTYPFDEDKGLPLASNEQAAAINAEVDRLLNIHDAIADLAIAEGVHQAAQGNHDRVAATLDAYSKTTFPPEPEVIQTSRSGIGLTHRVALHLEAGLNSTTSPVPDVALTPRARAEPALNKWLAGLLPPPDQIGCKFTFTDPVTQSQQNEIVTQQDLQLQPIDLLYLVLVDDRQAMAELDDRVLRHVINTFTPRPDTEIRIHYTERLKDRFSFFELAPLLNNLRALVLRSRPLQAADATLSSEATRTQEEIVFTDTGKDRLVLIKSGDSNSHDNSLEKLQADLVNFQSELQALVTDLNNKSEQLKASGADLTNFPPELAQLVVDLTNLRNQIFSRIDRDLNRLVELLVRAAGFGIPQTGWGFALDWKRQTFTGLLKEVNKLVKQWGDKLTMFDALIADYEALPAGTTDAEKWELLQQAERQVSTGLTTPLPATPADYRADVLDQKRADFVERLNKFKDIQNANTAKLSALRNAIKALLPVSEFDFLGLDLEDTEKKILLFASDILAQLNSLLKQINRRLAEAKKQLDDHDANTQAVKRVTALQNAAHALLGEDFHLVPEFELPLILGEEWEKALSASRKGGDLLKYLEEDLKQDFPVDDWLYGLGRVREKMKHWEQVVMLSEAFGQSSLELQPIQLPFIENDRWLALQFPPKRELNKEGDHLLYTAHYAVPFNKSGRQCGLLLDEWTEVIPAGQETTGIAFHFDRPNTEPPQVMLLVTPTDFRGAWQWQDLVDALIETLDAAKKRAVEPVHLDEKAYAHFLPATLVATTHREISIGLNLAHNVKMLDSIPEEHE